MIPLPHIAVASLLLGLLLAPDALAGARQAAAKDGNVLVYYCHNLSIVTVRVFPKRVEVETEARRATLVETTPESPVRYSNGSMTLSDLAEQVRLEEPGAVYFCRSLPSEVAWQEARFRGIEFRAAGDNPSWSLEIDSGVAIEFTSGQGDTRSVTRFPPAKFAGTDARMTLAALSGSLSLAVLAERRVCTLGESVMTLTVTITLNGKTYSGCGRTLPPTLP
jgi:hypothetical protein